MIIDSVSNMVIIIKFIVFSCIISSIQANLTKVSSKNPFLSRRKRYLTFPMGSSLIITISAVKAFLQIQPRGYNFLFEMDYPFPLPSDTRFFKNKKRHSMERRNVYSQLAFGLTENGFNGTACIKRMICDSEKLIPSRGKSLMKDLLLALFTYTDRDLEADYQEDCDTVIHMKCSVPLLDYVINSIEYREHSMDD